MVKAQHFAHPFAADGEAGGCHGGAAHGAEIDPLVGAQQALQVTGKVLVGTHVEVAQRYRLCLLGMVGVGGGDGVLVLLGLHQQRLHEEADGFADIQNGLTGIHALDGRVHVVAGAAGMHLAAHLKTYLIDEPFLYIGIEVRQTGFVGHNIRTLFFQAQQRLPNHSRILAGDDLLLGQHHHMGQMIQDLIGKGEIILGNGVFRMLVQDLDIPAGIGLVICFFVHSYSLL